MNEIKSKEVVLIQMLKEKAESKVSSVSSRFWMQKDFEFLIFSIEQDTGVLLSISTIKRIWKNEHHRLPHISTLDALSQFAIGRDWLVFKKEWLANNKKGLPSNKELTIARRQKVLAATILMLTIAVILFWNIGQLAESQKSVLFHKDSISFACQYSQDAGIPNSVLFNYDVSKVIADSFFIQQNWDQTRKIKIDPSKTMQTDIYLVPGYFYAKLIANDSVIKTANVNITYPDWFVAVRQPTGQVVSFNKNEWSQNGFIGITKKTLRDHDINKNDEFQLGYYNVRDFGTNGDNFSYHTNLNLGMSDDYACPEMNLLIKGDQSYIWITLIQRGCESNVQLVVSDLKFDGKTMNLFDFGIDANKWQHLSVDVKNKDITISINEKQIFHCTYNKSIGSIKEIDTFFNGGGKIDNVILMNSEEEVIFSDDFNQLTVQEI